MLWVAIKGRQPYWVAVLGAMLLVMHGITATLLPAGFGRTYAAYGGIFVIMALLWGWLIDKTKPDLYDIAGGAIILIGAAIIFCAPRKAL